MNIKKSLILFMTIVLVFSCKQDEVLDLNDGQTAGLTADLSKYDNSDMGTYKGVFTTLDSENRATVVISIRNNDIAIASLTLVSGEVIVLNAPTYKTGDVVNNLSFITTNESYLKSSFTFSVSNDGSDPIVSNVIYNGKESAILIAKNTSRAPLATLTGTYSCDNCATIYPDFIIGAQTWNVVLTAGNNVPFNVQFLLKDVVHNSIGTQSSCVNGQGQAPITCVTDGRKLTNYGTVMYTGTHAYPNGMGNVCSDVAGHWSLSIGGNLLTGTFDDDVPGGC